MTLENPRLVMTDWSWIARLGGQLSDIIQKMPEAAEYSRQLADHKIKADSQYKDMVDYINDPAKTPDAVIEALGVTRNELAKTVPKARKNVDPREFTGTLASWFEPLALKVKDVSPDALLSWVPKAPGDVANAPRISESVTAMKKLDEQNRIGQTTEAAMTPETTLTPQRTSENVSVDPNGQQWKTVVDRTEIGATAVPQTREQFQARFAEMAKPGGGQPLPRGFDAPASRPGLRPETTQTAVENNPQFAATQAGLPTQAAVASERYKTASLANQTASLGERIKNRNARVAIANAQIAASNDKQNIASFEKLRKSIEKETSIAQSAKQKVDDELAKGETGAAATEKLNLANALSDNYTDIADLIKDPLIGKQISSTELSTLMQDAFDAARSGEPFNVEVAAKEMFVSHGKMPGTPTAPTSGGKVDLNSFLK